MRAVRITVTAVILALSPACVDPPPVASAPAALVECNPATVGQPCDTDDQICTIERCLRVHGQAVCLPVGSEGGEVCESDADVCTVDTCVGGVCLHEPAPWCELDGGPGPIEDPLRGSVGPLYEGSDPGAALDAGSPDPDAALDRDAGASPFQGEIGGGGFGVGGCSATPRAGGLGLILIGLLAATTLRRRPRRIAGLVVTVAILGGAGTARAQVDVGVYRPATPGAGGFTTERSTTLPPGAIDLGLWFDSARDVLVVRDPDTGAVLPGGTLIGHRSTAYLGVAIGVLPGVEVDAQLPLVVDQQGDLSMVGGGSLPARAAGDLTLRVKVRLAGDRRWGLATLISGDLPTGDPATFSGATGPVAGARLVAGVRLGRTELSLAFGHVWRPRAMLGSLAVGDQWVIEAGGQLELLERRAWLAVDGYLAAGHDEVPAEVLAGPRVRVAGPWVAQVGLGVGITHGYGTPSLRGIGLIAWSPERRPHAPRIQPIRLPPAVDPPAAVEEPAAITTGDHDLLRDRDEMFAPPPPIEEIERIVLEDRVFFDTNRARVKTRARALLVAFVADWRAHPDWDGIVLEGHADERGGDAYNEWLGLERAQRVRRFLIKLGAPADRIEVVSFGKLRPVATGHGEAAQAKNRRVELVVVRRRR